jgi:gas vesicle protein
MVDQAVEMVDQIVPVVGAVGTAVGAVIGAVSANLVARFNRRGQMIDARRKAYANWFATADVMYHRLMTICEMEAEIPKDAEEQRAEEIDALAEENHKLLAAVNEVYFIETDAHVRRMLVMLHEMLAQIAAILRIFSSTYHDNLRLLQSLEDSHKMLREGIADPKVPPEGVIAGQELLKKTVLMQEEIRKRYIEGRLQSFRSKLIGTLNDVHDTTKELREELARLVSR